MERTANKGTDYSYRSWPAGVGGYIPGDGESFMGGGSRWGFQYMPAIAAEIKEEGDYNNMDILALLIITKGLKHPG